MSQGPEDPTQPNDGQQPPPTYGRQPYSDQFYGQPGYGQPAYGHPIGQPYNPAAPYGVHPVLGIPYSDKSKLTAGLLQLLLSGLCGVCGVGRLYSGQLGIGLTQLLMALLGGFLSFFLIGIPLLIGIWIWSVIDGILMLTGDPVDGAGRPLRPS